MEKFFAIVICVCLVLCVFNFCFPDNSRSENTFDNSFNRFYQKLSEPLNKIQTAYDFTSGAFSSALSVIQDIFTSMSEVFTSIGKVLIRIYHSICEFFGIEYIWDCTIDGHSFATSPIDGREYCTECDFSFYPPNLILPH